MVRDNTHNMSKQRITALDPDTATGKAKELFNAVQGKLGMVPNMMRTMGTSPALLNGYLSLSGALAEGSIRPGLGEQIALAVANANACNYCNAAHTFIGEKLAGLKMPAIHLAREGRATDGREQAAITFARVLVAKRGLVSDGDVTAARTGGLDDAAIAEVVGHVALNILTNYFNNTAGTVVDFPEVELVEAASV